MSKNQDNDRSTISQIIVVIPILNKPALNMNLVENPIDEDIDITNNMGNNILNIQ